MSADLIYRRVPISLWAQLAGLPADPIVVAFRARTGPETVAIPGIAIAGRAGLAEALGWPVRRLEAAANALEALGMVRIDWTARLLWSPAVIGETPPANPNMVLGWRSAWAQIPTCPLREEIRGQLWAAITDRGETYREALATAIGKEQSPEPFPERSPKPFLQPLREQEEEEDQEGDQGIGGGGGRTAASSGANGLPEPDRDAAFGAWCAAREAASRRAGTGAIDLAESDEDRQAFLSAVGKLKADLRPFAGHAARIFFSRDGRDKRDAYWRDKRWSLHVFTRQGLPTLIEEARRAGAANERVQAERDRERAEREAEKARREKLRAAFPLSWELHERSFREWFVLLRSCGVPSDATEEQKNAAVEKHLAAQPTEAAS